MTKKQIEQTEIKAPYELPEGWKWCRQNEVCKLTDGEKLTGVDYPYLEVKYLRGNKDKEIVSSGKFIKQGTKVILVDGENSGEVFTVPEDGFMGSTFKSLSIQNVDENYLQFFISTKKDLYRNNKKGSAIPHLNKELFFNMPFPLPPTLEEQQRIVNRIETLFAKLDQAKEKAQNVVDTFETRKALILHKAFNNQLKIDNEELKDEDWIETTIGECGNWYGGGTPNTSTEEYWKDGTILWITSKDMKSDYIEDTQLHVTQMGVENSSAKLIKEPAVLFVMRSGILRRTFPVCMVEKEFTVNQDLKALIPFDNINLKFLFYICKANEKKILNECMKNGTTVESINAQSLMNLNIKLPPINYQLSIVNFLDTVLEKENQAKEAALAVLEQIELLKKSILARAFRGEI